MANNGYSISNNSDKIRIYINECLSILHTNKRSQINQQSMDKWNEYYEPCEVTIDIECEELPQEYYEQLYSSPTPQPPSQKPPSKQRNNPKPKKEIRLSMKSPELKMRFETVIKTVPGRTEQAKRIFDFIASSENGSSSPLCLHGNTGCGKTSLINKVLEFFEQNSNTVSVAYLNCMSIRTVNLIYAFLLDRFFAGKRRAGRAPEALRTCLLNDIGKQEKTKIVVLDEIDHVISEQNFLYNMLEWLSVGAKLILVLISNVIDLVVKLDGKLQSRWKFQTIIFQPYSHTQIESIIYHKYKDIREFCKKDAITFIAKRIYNINSDIRTLDKIYNRIIKKYDDGGRKLLDIDSVKNLIYDQSKAPPMENSYIALTNILARAEKKSDVSQAIFQHLYVKMRSKRFPQKEDVLYMLCDLQDYGLITLSANRKASDITFHDYGIKIHENLRLFIENSDK